MLTLHTQKRAKVQKDLPKHPIHDNHQFINYYSMKKIVQKDNLHFLHILGLSIFLLFLSALSATAGVADHKSSITSAKDVKQTVVTGSVKDQVGALPGVNIKIKGTNQGTITGLDGQFSISVSKPDAVLVFSFIGFQTQEIALDGKTSIDVVMVEDSKNLEEVVVVGYGTSRKKDLTGASANVSDKEFNQGASTNPLQLFAGKAAGVSVSQTGSEPGSAPSVRVRGITSLMGGNDPLVVVDGIQGNMDLLKQIPTSEIESIDILKDASATAIYGSRGAPGVIMVTTKRNKENKVTIEYNGTSSIDFIPKKLEVLNASQWAEQAKIWSVPASQNHGSDTDWYNLLTQNGSTQNHTISLGGGNGGLNYRASGTAILQDGVVIKSNSKTYIGRIQATQKALDDKLTITMNLNSSINTTVGSPTSVGRASFTSNLISNAYVSRPTDPVLNTDGSYYSDPNVFQYINPYAVAQTVVNEGQTNNLFGSLKADAELMKGLTLSWFGSWRRVDATNGYYLPAKSTIASAIDNNGIANISNNDQDEKLTDLSIAYKKTIGAHNFDAIAVYEWQKQTYQGSFSQAKGFINDIATYNALQLGDNSKVLPGDLSSYKNDRSLVSFLARVNYSFKDRYLLTGSIRRDASSVFGANYKSGNFPSASIAWRVIEESFMKNQNVLSDLKFRAGYGVTGNQQGLGPQNSIQLVGASGVTYFGGNPITNYMITQNSNADLRWETRTQTNLGLDFGFLKGRISGTIDVYRATTKNLLFNYTVPQPPYPYGSIVANVGSIENKGLEATLNLLVYKTKDLNVNISSNVSFLKNKVLELSGSINGDPLNSDYVSWGSNSYLIKGQPIGSFYILQHLGKDAANAETVVDQNKDGIIDQGNTSPDRVLSGSALPTYTFSINPSVSYKNFDLTMSIRGAGGNKVYNNMRASLSYFESLGKSNVLTSAIPMGLSTSKYGSDLWLEDGAFVRFDNLSLSYRFNTSSLKHIGGIKLSLTGNNLAVFTKYKGIDPELNTSGSSGFGSDNGIYPRVRSFAVGLNVTLK